MSENNFEISSENMEGTEIYTSLFNTEDNMENVELVEQSSGSDVYINQIAGDIRIILVIVLLSFCWSCMRAWRKSSIKHM